jgi:hypothetical protein
MLRPTKFADDMLYAMSMYFASELKTHLLNLNEDVWTYVLLISSLIIQVRVEIAFAKWHEKQESAPAEGEVDYYFLDVLKEAMFIVTRTIAFLVLQMTIHLVTLNALTGVLWMENIILPVLILLVGTVTVVSAKHYLCEKKKEK